MTDFVAYQRVSTQGQGRSGLGLEAQRAAIEAHLRPTDRLLATYVEVESAAKRRPQLAAALDRCRLTGATLLIAKLDRLARSVALVSSLMETRVPFVAADMPEANRLTVHVIAAVAEHERHLISERTRAALAAAKARGVQLGGDRGWRPTPAHAATARAVLRAEAARRAALLLPAVERARAAGAGTLAGIAAALEREGVRAPRGGSRWTATAVRRVLARANGWRAGSAT